MDIGLDSFALHPLNLDPFEQLTWAWEHEFAGIQLGDVAGLAAGPDPSCTPEHGEVWLRNIRAHADALGLYTHVSIGGCNPVFTGRSEPDLVEAVSHRIRLAARFGWHELHGVLGGPDERCHPSVPWTRQLDASSHVLQALAPVLRDHGSRINLETHGDATTFELVRLAEQIGPDVLGICLDTANVLLHGEHPVLAARRAAPYTHLTHCKDAIVFFIDSGLRRQTLPPGSGLIDWLALISELVPHQLDLKLTIEDHKWLFDAEVFEPRWMAMHPDVPRDEVLQLLKLAWGCQERIARGELRDPEDYETVTYGDEMEVRLASGRDHLQAVVAGLGQ